MSQSAPNPSLPPKPRSMPLQLGVISFTRTVIYTGHRMVFPFLPALARGMEVSLETAALAITVRSALGMLSPLLGSLGDTRGRKWALRAGLGLIAAGTLLVGFFPTFLSFLVGSMLFGMGIVIFDPSIQAYVSDRVPYRRRALAMAVIEFGWSGAFLIGIPLVGRVISRSSWSTPFLWVGGMMVLSLILIDWVLPPSSVPAGRRLDLKAGLKKTIRHRPSMAAVGVSFLMITGSRGVMIVYGAWFEKVFRMTEQTLGDVSSVIGVAGITGLVLVGLLTDRLGKKLALGLGLTVNLLSALLFPLLEGSVVLTVSNLFVYYLAFEFALVTALSLVSELRPEARATLMAFHAAAVSAGDALGSFLGPRLYQGGMIMNSGLAVGLNLLALTVLVLWVKVED